MGSPERNNVQAYKVRLLLNKHITKLWDALWKDHCINAVQLNTRHHLSQSFASQGYQEPAGEFSNRISSRHYTAVSSLVTWVILLCKCSPQKDGNTAAWWQWRQKAKLKLQNIFVFQRKEIANKLFFKRSFYSSRLFYIQTYNQPEFKDSFARLAYNTLSFSDPIKLHSLAYIF